MIISYIKNGNEIEFLNTYSTFDSAIHGFHKECKRIAEEQGVKSIDVAGEQAFLSNMNFICAYGGRYKTCKSIKEMERWLMNHLDMIKSISIRSECEEINDMYLDVLSGTKPVFFGQANTKSKFLKDMFDKKAKNWMVDLI